MGGKRGGEVGHLWEGHRRGIWEGESSARLQRHEKRHDHAVRARPVLAVVEGLVNIAVAFLVAALHPADSAAPAAE